MVSLPTIKGPQIKMVPQEMQLEENQNKKSSNDELLTYEHGADESFGSPQNDLHRNIPKNSILQQYHNFCFKDSLIPDTDILKFLEEEKKTLNLSNKRLRIKHWKALLKTILNYNVSKMNLSFSNISLKCFKCLQATLLQNHHIANLNLSGVSLHGKGASILGNAFKESDILIQNLNLSQCQLDGNDLKMFKHYFSTNMMLLKLNLSSNSIGEDGGRCCGEILRKNRYLEKFDLSWNQIRRSGGISMMEGLKNNNSLLYLNLSFNGLGDDGATETGVMLEVNETLVSLNLRDNRITNQGVQYIAYGMTQNSTLSSLDLSGNLVTAVGMQHILAGAIKSGSLNELYIRQVSPDVLCIRAIQHLKRLKPSMVVEHGTMSIVKSDGGSLSGKFTVREEVFDEIKTYVSRERLRLLDLFKMWDKEKSGDLTKDELGRGLMAAGIPVTVAILDEVFVRLDNDGNGTVNYTEFIRNLLT